VALAAGSKGEPVFKESLITHAAVAHAQTGGLDSSTRALIRVGARTGDAGVARQALTHRRPLAEPTVVSVRGGGFAWTTALVAALAACAAAALAAVVLRRSRRSAETASHADVPA
jgi:hypothetical protein